MEQEGILWTNILSLICHNSYKNIHARVVSNGRQTDGRGEVLSAYKLISAGKKNTVYMNKTTLIILEKAY